LAEALNLIVASWVLIAELVAGKADDGKVVGVCSFEVFVKLFEAFKLWREATL